MLVWLGPALSVGGLVVEAAGVAIFTRDVLRANESRGVALVSPVTDHPFGHRTIFFRDPDGNVLEIYAEI